MGVSFGIDDFGAFMCKHDRGAGKVVLKDAFVGKRVFSRFYGNGTITDIKDGALYVHFDSNQDRIFTSAEYLWEEI